MGCCPCPLPLPPIFPLFAWPPQLGTAGLHPRLSCPENCGMAKVCLGWSRQGDCQRSWFHVSSPYFKPQDYPEGATCIFSPSLKENPLLPLWSMWWPFLPWKQTSVSPGPKLGQPCLTLLWVLPLHRVGASQSICPHCLARWSMEWVQATLTKVNRTSPSCRPTQSGKPTLGKWRRMGWEWGGKWKLWLGTLRSSAWMQMSSFHSAHPSVSAKFSVSDIPEFANLYFIFLNTLLE